MASSAKKLPFFLEITPVEERWLKEDGRLEKLGMPLVTLPAGTVLFRSLRLPLVGQYWYSVQHFYRDYLGDSLDPDTTCVSPKHNIFFSASPFIGFGLHNIGKNMNAYMAFVLVHPITVIAAISPSIMVRGAPHVFSGLAPIQRCSTLPYDCKTPDFALQKALEYDNCIHPLYSLRTGVRGWMAIADLDSAYPHSLRKKRQQATNAELYLYMNKLKTRHPEIANELIANMYTDGHHHAGFPEIALYPYKKHHGEMLTMFLNVRTEEQAQRAIYKEAIQDNLNYLPLALFTADKTVDFTQGLFTRQRFDPMPYLDLAPRQEGIENQMIAWLTEAKTNGIDLPHYGKGKMMFDSRTGFYVLEQFVPERFMIRLPKHAVESDTKRLTDKKVRLFEPYKKLLLPLATEEDKKRVLTYTLLFRSWNPKKFMHAYGIEKGWGTRRAFVFERPPVLASVYKSWNWEIPKEFTGTLARAAAMYQKETGKMPKAKTVKESKGEDGQGVQAVKTMEDMAFEQIYGMPVSAWNRRPGTEQATTASAATFQSMRQQQQAQTPPYGFGFSGFPQQQASSPPFVPLPGTTAAKSPPYSALSPAYNPYNPTSPAYNPTSPAYYPPTSPVYYPPTSPVYGATTNGQQQQQQTYTPEFGREEAAALQQKQQASTTPKFGAEEARTPSFFAYTAQSPYYGATTSTTPQFGAEEATVVSNNTQGQKKKNTPEFQEGGKRKAKKQTRARKQKGKQQTRRKPKSPVIFSVFDIWKVHAISKTRQQDTD